MDQIQNGVEILMQEYFTYMSRKSVLRWKMSFMNMNEKILTAFPNVGIEFRLFFFIINHFLDLKCP